MTRKTLKMGLAGFEQGTSSNDVSPFKDNDLPAFDDLSLEAVGAKSGAAMLRKAAQGVVLRAFACLRHTDPEVAQRVFKSLSTDQQAELLRMILSLPDEDE